MIITTNVCISPDKKKSLITLKVENMVLDEFMNRKTIVLIC